MKRMLCLLAALLMCAGFVLPVYANRFVPSVSRPEKPEIGNVILIDKDKREENDHHDGKGHGKGEVVDPCIVITTVNEAKEKTTDISQPERDQLVDIHEKIMEDTIQLPIPRSYAVLQVVSVNWEYDDCVTTDHTHKEELEQEETVLVADFDLGVAADVEVMVLVYAQDQWVPVETVTNNGDGTITCELQHVGPVVFSVPGEEPPAVTTAPVMPEPAEEVEYPLLWVILLIVAFLLFLLLIFLWRKRKKDEEEEERK